MSPTSIFFMLAQRIRHAGRRTARLITGLMAVLALSAVPLMSGCGGGAATGDSGQLLVSLTDADGDFIAYEVDVESLQLTHRDGTVVEVLPISTRVDFAQYTDLTEFLVASTLPRGDYVAAKMRLDYSNADVQVEVAGAPVAAAVVDADGTSLTRIEVDVKLDDRNHLPIRPGIPAHVVFDFDLATSNKVDLTDPTLPLVMVDPVLLASINPDTTKRHRIRGLLDQVEVAESEFSLHVRPFGHRGPNHDFGSFDVHTASDTMYEIDGVSYTGEAGLLALSNKPERTPVVAFGKVNRHDRTLHASHVRAGTSVDWGNADRVRGTVVARDGDLLTLQGAALRWAHPATDAITDQRNVHLRRQIVKVQLGPDTRVTGMGGTDELLDKDDISVGQRITAKGIWLVNIAAAIVAPDFPTLDASQGHVRLRSTDLAGTVVAVTPGELVVEVAHFNRHPVGQFNFAGTGATPDTDADPLQYQIATGDLLLDHLTVGDRVRVWGRVARFGTAPADFSARSVSGPPVVIDRFGFLRVAWTPATTTPVMASGPDGLSLDLTDSPTIHHIYQRHQITDLATLSGTKVVPPANGYGVYALIHPRGRTTLFRTFAAFEEALSKHLADNGKVSRMTGSGQWDGATLSARTLMVWAPRQPRPIPIDVRPVDRVHPVVRAVPVMQ